jgi:uncharacterized coiled-coil protein SlyX
MSQIKFSTKSLVNRVEHLENKVSGAEEKVKELDQIVKDHERMLRKYEWNMQDIWDNMKRPNLQIMGIKEGEEMHHTKWRTTEPVPVKVRNETGLSTFSTPIQYSFGIPSQSNKTKARNKRDSNREGRS